MEGQLAYVLMVAFGSIASYRVARYIVPTKSDADGGFLAVLASVFFVAAVNNALFESGSWREFRGNAWPILPCYFFILGLYVARGAAIYAYADDRIYRHPSLRDIDRAFYRVSPFGFVLWLIFLFAPMPRFCVRLATVAISSIYGREVDIDDPCMSMSEYHRVLLQMDEYSERELARDLDLNPDQIKRLHELRVRPSAHLSNKTNPA
jgi:hypothetical protein